MRIPLAEIKKGVDDRVVAALKAGEEVTFETDFEPGVALEFGTTYGLSIGETKENGTTTWALVG